MTIYAMRGANHHPVTVFQEFPIQGRLRSEAAMFERFEEEIGELRKSANLPYTYLVNDRLERVIAKLLHKTDPGS